MNNQDSNEEPDMYELLRKLIEMSRADTGTHDQISAVREEVQTAINEISQLKTETEGAVDTNFRLTADVDKRLGEIANLAHGLNDDLRRQQTINKALFCVNLFHTFAAIRLCSDTPEAFRELHLRRYVDAIVRVGHLLNECESADVNDLPSISLQVDSAFNQVFELPNPTTEEG